MPSTKTNGKKSDPKPQAEKPADTHHHKFIWNWRMLVLGILLNIATLALVVYTVSLLKDYRECTQGYTDILEQSILPADEDDIDLNTNASVDEVLELEEGGGDVIDLEADGSLEEESVVEDATNLNVNSVLE